MKLIEPTFEIIEQEPGIDGIYKQIERAARTCYKSEDKIGTIEQTKEFVQRLLNSGHGAMLEHGTVYLKDTSCVDNLGYNDWRLDVSFYSKNPYSRVYRVIEYNTETIYITTNLRVLAENNKLNDLLFFCEPTENHQKRYTVKFVCDRGISHEFVRHRVFSFAQESTRYCNYSKGKFGSELTFIKPCWLRSENEPGYNEFVNSCKQCETDYFKLLELGWQPQQARSVLLTSIKTELIMTGFASEWKSFFKLRTPNNAHIQARELALPLEGVMVKNGFI